MQNYKKIFGIDFCYQCIENIRITFVLNKKEPNSDLNNFINNCYKFKNKCDLYIDDESESEPIKNIEHIVLSSLIVKNRNDLSNIFDKLIYSDLNNIFYIKKITNDLRSNFKFGESKSDTIDVMFKNNKVSNIVSKNKQCNNNKCVIHPSNEYVIDDLRSCINCIYTQTGGNNIMSFYKENDQIIFQPRQSIKHLIASVIIYMIYGDSKIKDNKTLIENMENNNFMNNDFFKQLINDWHISNNNNNNSCISYGEINEHLIKKNGIGNPFFEFDFKSIINNHEDNCFEIKKYNNINQSTFKNNKDALTKLTGFGLIKVSNFTSNSFHNLRQYYENKPQNKTQNKTRLNPKSIPFKPFKSKNIILRYILERYN